MGSWMLQWFEFGQLPPHLQVVSKLFKALAEGMYAGEDALLKQAIKLIESGDFGDNPEAQHARAKLIEADYKFTSNAEKDAQGVEIDFAPMVVESPFEENRPALRWDIEDILRLVLEAKDCAVRARLWQSKQPGWEQAQADAAGVSSAG